MVTEGRRGRVARYLAAGITPLALTLGPVHPARAEPAVSDGTAIPLRTCTIPPHLPKGDIVVAVVVDFGSPGDRVLVSCIAARPGTTGAEILSAQASQLSAPGPRYNSSGLLCAIDGFPESGCGTQAGSHFAYWAYWHGGRTWTYAELGPAEWQITKGDVEGWRFEPDGSASPADPVPRASPLAAHLELPATTADGSATGEAVRSVPSARRSQVPFTFGFAALAVVVLGAAAIARTRRRARPI